MFGKKQQTPSAITVIAAGSKIEGTLRVRGLVQIDGTIDGHLIVEGQVSVGPEGKIRGDVSADDLVVGGNIEGQLVARGHLHLLATGVVHGEARYATLQVDRGGVMVGRTNLSGDSKAVPDNDVELIADAAAE